MKNNKKETVKILGYEVKVGTKKYFELVERKKQFDDLNKYEI
jgi:hypothetical protein